MAQPQQSNYMRMPPQSLTIGMPDPATINKQKDTYNQMMDQQLKQGMDVLQAQVKYQKDYLHGQAQQQKAQFMMQIDMEVKQQEMQLEQQYAEQSMSLKAQEQEQRAALEMQAMQLTLDYNQRKSEDNMMKQQQTIEKNHNERQSEMHTEMVRISQQNPSLPPPGTFSNPMGPSVSSMQSGTFQAPQAQYGTGFGLTMPGMLGQKMGTFGGVPPQAGRMGFAGAGQQPRTTYTRTPAGDLVQKF